MAAIGTADVTYTIIQPVTKTEGGEKWTKLDIAFGDGVKTYPANGVPLTKAKMNCPNSLTTFDFHDMSSGDGYLYKYDRVHASIRIYQASNGSISTVGPLIELSTAATPAATTLRAVTRGW